MSTSDIWLVGDESACRAAQEWAQKRAPVVPIKMLAASDLAHRVADPSAGPRGPEPWLISVNSTAIIGRAVLERFGGRAVNIHPGRLPDFGGLYAVQWAVRLGESATVAVTTASADNALVVPTLAIATAGTRQTVTVQRNGTDTPVAVTTGITANGRTQVLTGLSDGDQIVLPSVTGTTDTSTQSPRGLFGGGGLGGGNGGTGGNNGTRGGTGGGSNSGTGR